MGGDGWRFRKLHGLHRYVVTWNRFRTATEKSLPFVDSFFTVLVVLGPNRFVMAIKVLFFIGCSFDVGCELNFRRLAGTLSAETRPGELQIEPCHGFIC
jgi:hypothetical protein